MPRRQARVLLGDSTPSELPPNVLDLITEVVICARDVATPYAEMHELERRRADAARVTEAIIKELQGFGRQTEVGVSATARVAIRPEVRAHGDEVIAAVSRMVDGWIRQYERKRDAADNAASQRTTQLRQGMHQALERFLLPRRAEAPIQRFHRFFDGQSYVDSAVVEPLEGIRLKLALRDPEPEVPRRLRSLIGKTKKIQVGTRLSRIRKIEEPVLSTIDDMVLLDAERGPGRLRLQLAKKPGTPDVVRIEIARSEDGILAGRVARADGATVDSPIGDRPVLEALWTAMDAERERILGCTAQLMELDLDGRRVEDADGSLAVAERLVDCHRSTFTTLARHSPNPEELTIKIETEAGKREEAWVRREDLAQHLLGLPSDLRGRLGIAELFDGGAMLEAKTSVHTAVSVTAVDSAVDEDHSLPIEIVPETLGDGVPEAPVGDMTQDISLDELIVESGPIDAGCVDSTLVRSR